MTDFIGFTKISENLTPVELVSEIHECFKAFDSIVEKYGLEKIKTVGDAYIAVSGLPAANPNHAILTAKAALEMRDFMLIRAKSEKQITDIRIGIHTGNVVAGIVGVKKFAYDIWGDAVNTAARMEQNCDSAKVNASGAIKILLQNDFHCEYRGVIEAKNKGEIEMYFIEHSILV